MALEEKVSTLPIMWETGLLIKETLLFSENHLQAERILHTADLAPVSAVEVTPQKKAKLTLSISLNIEVCIFKSSPFFFFFATSTDKNVLSQIALYVLYYF